MPSDVQGGRGRASIYDWRVKAGSREVYSDPKKSTCQQMMRSHGGKIDGKKLRLIPPNPRHK